MDAQPAAASSPILAYISAVTPVLIAVLGMWWDTRKHQNKLHEENQRRLGTMERNIETHETKLDPIWKWWNQRAQNLGGNGGAK